MKHLKTYLAFPLTTMYFKIHVDSVLSVGYLTTVFPESNLTVNTRVVHDGYRTVKDPCFD